MRRVTLSIIMAVLLAGMPIAVVAGPQFSCKLQECCCRATAIHHHAKTGMVDFSCTCQMNPLSACHIGSKPPLPGLVVTRSTGQEENTGLSSMSVIRGIDPIERLLAGATGLIPEVKTLLHAPPAYLRYCILII